MRATVVESFGGLTQPNSANGGSAADVARAPADARARGAPAPAPANPPAAEAALKRAGPTVAAAAGVETVAAPPARAGSAPRRPPHAPSRAASEKALNVRAACTMLAS